MRAAGVSWQGKTERAWMAWHWVKTKGWALEPVCGGESHWRAEEEGEVEKEIRNWDWESRVRVRAWPLMGSAAGEREKGMGRRVEGSTTEWIERERVSRRRGPVWGPGRE